MENKKVLTLNTILLTYFIIQIPLVLASNIVRNRGEHELATLIRNISEISTAIFLIIYGLRIYNKSKKWSYLCFITSMFIIINYILRLSY